MCAWHLCCLVLGILSLLAVLPQITASKHYKNDEESEYGAEK